MSNINKEEINKKATAILAQYRVGKSMVNSAQTEMNGILGVSKTTPIQIEQLYSSAPEGVDEYCYNFLVDVVNTGMSIENECSEKMRKLFKPVIRHIIETEYAAYKEHSLELEDEGSATVNVCIKNEYPDIYTSYCSKIRYKIHQFLLQNNLLKE